MVVFRAFIKVYLFSKNCFILLAYYSANTIQLYILFYIYFNSLLV